MAKETSHPPNRIREFRVSRGFSLQEVADALALSVSTVQRYEMSERPLNTQRLNQFAKTLKCGAADLLVLPARKGADDQETRLLAMWARMSAEQRDRALTMLGLLLEAPPPPRRHRRQRLAPAAAE